MSNDHLGDSRCHHDCDLVLRLRLVHIRRWPEGALRLPCFRCLPCATLGGGGKVALGATKGPGPCDGMFVLRFASLRLIKIPNPSMP